MPNILPLKDNQAADVLVFRRWSEKLRREWGLETAWSANWISPFEMTWSKKWNVILAHAGRNAKHVNVKSIFFFFLSFSFRMLILLTVLRCVRHKSSQWGWEPAACSSSRHSETNRLILYGESYSCLQIVCHSFNPAWTNYLLRRCCSH